MTTPHSPSPKRFFVSNSDLTDPDNQFRQMYLSDPAQPTEEDRKARELALEYHRRTEEYDQTICTGKDRHGYGDPQTGWERTMITRNAHKVRKDIEQKAREQKVSLSKVQAAIRVVGREVDRGITSI